MTEENAKSTAPVHAVVLLPCPFCGHDDIAVEQAGTGRQSCIIACEWCGCRLKSNENGYGNAWNSRPDVYPVFDTLQRLWCDGYVTKEQDGEWWLFRKDGEGIVSGGDFRGLCVNIVLAGL